MANENNAGHQHKWRFFRSGGFDQVRLETAEDLRNLESLDQKLWAALACPTQGVEFDEKTLAILDADKDEPPDTETRVAILMRIPRGQGPRRSPSRCAPGRRSRRPRP